LLIRKKGKLGEKQQLMKLTVELLGGPILA
jgi:hypothetical protein